MTVAGQTTRIAEHLEEIVLRGGIPAPYDRWGARLLGHLRRPVRIVVTGLPGSGKTALLEMVSGQSLGGPARGLPVIEVTHGDMERVILERADGSVATLPGRLAACAIPEGTLRATQETPDMRLQGQCLVELGLTGDAAAMQATLARIAAEANIVIWCSQEFTAPEQRLWSAMPDRIKDHGLLALTKADVLVRSGALSSTIERLGPVVADEFLGMYPVATLQAIAARSEGGDPQLWASSGGRPLMQSLTRQIRLGRSADIDSAQVFLDRLNARARRGAVNEDEPPRLHDPREGSKQPAARAPAPGPQGASILSEAIDLLQDRGRRMLDEIDCLGGFDPEAILSSCSAALSALSDLVDKAGPEDPRCRIARDSIEEGDELLMLFRLEQGEEAALDAVTLLLQLRKELIRQADE